jgi:hypothetical protein
MRETILCVLLCAGVSACASDGADERGGAAGSGAPAADGGSASAGSGAGESGAAGDLGTSMAGTGGAAGAGPALGNAPGQFTPRSDLDKDAKFEWTESLPGQGTCKAGKYTGMFMCEYVPNGGMSGMGTMVSGPVTFELKESSNGEFLEIADGNLTGVAQGVFGFTSMLSGKLDCSTLELTADAVMGTYGFGDPKVFPIGTFMGTLGGKFDQQNLTLSGDWSLTEMSGGVCKGPWMASFTP